MGEKRNFQNRFFDPEKSRRRQNNLDSGDATWQTPKQKFEQMFVLFALGCPSLERHERVLILSIMKGTNAALKLMFGHFGNACPTRVE